MMAWRTRGDSSVRAVRRVGLNLGSWSFPIAVVALARMLGLGSLAQLRPRRIVTWSIGKLN
jgi:hypothetical protein